MKTEYFSMQGRVAIGLLNADGTRQPARWVGDASTLEWNLSVDETDINEAYSGVRGLAATLKKSKKMDVKVNLKQISDANAALAVNGTEVAVVSGSVTDETIGDVKAGDMVALEYAKVSALVLAGTAPVAPVDGTDYKLNATTGVLTFLTDCTGVKASAYDYAAHSLVTVFSGNTPNMYVLFDGENTVDGTTLLARGEVYKIQFSPASTLGMIQDDVGSLELTGKARIDASRVDNSNYGGYARLMLLDPAA